MLKIFTTKAQRHEAIQLLEGYGYMAGWSVKICLFRSFGRWYWDVLLTLKFKGVFHVEYN